MKKILKIILEIQRDKQVEGVVPTYALRREIIQRLPAYGLSITEMDEFLLALIRSFILVAHQTLNDVAFQISLFANIKNS